MFRVKSNKMGVTDIQNGKSNRSESFDENFIAYDKPVEKYKKDFDENCDAWDEKTVDNRDNKYVNLETDFTYKHQLQWTLIIYFGVLHALLPWAVYRMLFGYVRLSTVFFAYFVGYFSAEGVTVGAHRFFSHRSFKAKPILRLLMIFAFIVAGQRSLFLWCRDHRLHHRYADTDADPHNAKRGFFFSHMGWMFVERHPIATELGRRVDMSDLKEDWIVMFQKRHFLKLFFALGIIAPCWIAVRFLGETWLNSFLVVFVVRYLQSVHFTWLVNSAAHLYGTRPYDKNILGVESMFISILTLGEGWHNYHHAFPWDYKTAELSRHINFSASLIRFFERVGLAYDLKTASQEMVDTRIVRRGDGTHEKLGNDEARAAVTALGIVHPLNPSYSVTYPAPTPKAWYCTAVS